MITVSLDSLAMATELLKGLSNIANSNIYINDGYTVRKLLDFDVLTTDFEVGGMYQTVESAYILHFQESSIKYSIKSNEAIVQPFQPVTATLQQSSVPSSVSADNF
ncbi:hypothetical protein F0224_07765 [Vibrio coralliilyticus]|uniref:hypothetical protein n=1 Tax=Vibrio coralliilyticus TaxID=190893 RepID=UPI000BAC2923|nr:hypothetical protein [Vibrio coralliilyticus]NOI75571.1 hypothetical protein [Vibrio coralliilyticus]PAW04391.1 hypothetical protein CKJ79_06580 [Vibrio coralliilyticus]